MNKETKLIIRDIVIIVTVLAILAFLATSLTGCKSLKTVSHSTKDSIVIKLHDSTIYNTVTNTKDSIRYRDSVIITKASSVDTAIPHGSTADFHIKKGNATIHRTVDNGVEHITAECNELVIKVTDLEYVYHLEQKKTDSLVKLVSDSKVSHAETTVKEVSKSWWGKLVAGIGKGLLFIIGLIIGAVIGWLIKKFF